MKKQPRRENAAGTRMIRRLRGKLAAAQLEIIRLRAASETDFLLGIPNRRGLERALDRAAAYIRRYPASGALIAFDVDRLKPINDTFGHAAGDAVLKAVVGVLQQNVRSSDVLARLGGDEFALLLWNLDGDAAAAKVGALEAAVDRLGLVFDGQAITVGISGGATELDPHTGIAEMLARADRAMYARKLARRQRPDA